MTLWIFTQQKASLPAWVPLVGEEFDHITAEFTTAQAVTPGQGQAVDIAGIQIGKVTSVDLEDGHAVVGMDIEPKYMELIHPDATLLLRPKTNLNDMIVEIDPGNAPRGTSRTGHNFPLSRTEPNVNLDAFLATLDADTRQYIQLLVAGGAQGIGGRGSQLSGAFRRLQPFAHYVADLNRRRRRRAASRSPNVIHNFGLLTTELGRHDAADRALRHLLQGRARQLRQPAGRRSRRRWSSSRRRWRARRPASPAPTASPTAPARRCSSLIPQAQALGPAFDANERFFDQTTGADPRPDPALHPPDPPGPHPRQAGRRPTSRRP